MQIIIRILGAGIPVFDFIAGEIVNGQFAPFQDLHDRMQDFFPVEELVTFSDILGGQAFVSTESLGPLVAVLTDRHDFAGMQFYPNFMIFNFESHEQTEEKDA